MAKKKVQQQDDLLQMEMSIIDKYKKPFIWGCVALVVIVAIVALYQGYSAKINNEAQEDLFAGEAYFRNGQYDLALNGDSTGYKGFIVLSEGSTKAANMACLYAGLSYAQTSQWSDAVKYLEKFDTKGDHTISPAAIHALGNCYANLGELDKAANTLEKAAKMADGGSIAPVCLMEAAGLYETLEKKAEARRIYEIIKKDYPHTMQGSQIEKYLMRVAE